MASPLGVLVCLESADEEWTAARHAAALISTTAAPLEKMTSWLRALLDAADEKLTKICFCSPGNACAAEQDRLPIG